MNRFRTLDLRHAVMPFVLAALALRALIPAGFMPGSSESFAFTAMLCAPQNAGAVTMQRFELPGDPDAHAQPHCDFCIAPALGAPPAIEAARLELDVASLAPARLDEQIASRSPDRAPSARAPPA